MGRIHSYVVRYDSGFAPNPFYGFCTLATCKPDIRRSADIGDWVVGSGSAAKDVDRGGCLVYAMRITEAMGFDDYDRDVRFASKRPYRAGSRKQSCGDNIYFRAPDGVSWLQRDSFHSSADGTLHQQHLDIDTAVDRVLVSDDFVYFGGEGPPIPEDLLDHDGRWICKSGIGRSCFDDALLIRDFESWVRGLGVWGYQGAPFEWLTLRSRDR